MWPTKKKAFLPGSGKCWGRAAGRERGGICQNCKCTYMPTHEQIHFQISTDRRHPSSHLSTTLPMTERNGDKPVAAGWKEKRRHPHLAGVLPAAVVQGSPGAQTTQSPLLQPWAPQDPGEALGDEQARGRCPSTHQTGQARDHSLVCQETPHREGAPSPAAVFALEGRPHAHPQVRRWDAGAARRTSPVSTARR